MLISKVGGRNVGFEQVLDAYALQASKDKGALKILIDMSTID